jgi:hypothetical protein
MPVDCSVVLSCYVVMAGRVTVSDFGEFLCGSDLLLLFPILSPQVKLGVAVVPQCGGEG